MVRLERVLTGEGMIDGTFDGFRGNVNMTRGLTPCHVLEAAEGKKGNRK